MTKKNYERPIVRSLNSASMNKFGSRFDQLPLSYIDGVAVSSLTSRYGSPLFVFSERQLRENTKTIRRAFENRYPKVHFAWSYKTNYLNAICKIFHQEGWGAEVVSRFEYDKAIRNGMSGNRILFNGPDKTDDDLRTAISNDSPIHIDHLDELYRLTGIASGMKIKPRVAIRVNMDTGVHPIWDRFGFNYESGQALDAVNKIVSGGKLKLIGLHTHIGTYVLSTHAYATAAQKMAELALQVKTQHGVAVEYIDMGGGFASQNTLKGSYLKGADVAPTFNEYAEAICSTLMGAGFKTDELPALILETGRALVDNAGYLLGTVIANKRLTDGRKATILDFGTNILFTSHWYDHKITPAQEFGLHTEETVLYGPLCMNIDIIRDNILLPPLNAGDNLVAQHVGAYNITQSMQFITLRPTVVLIDKKNTVHIIKKKETLEDLQRSEQVPEYLQ